MTDPVIHSIIFGYGHRARSGKDTAASILIADRGAAWKDSIYGKSYDIRRCHGTQARSQQECHAIWWHDQTMY